MGYGLVGWWWSGLWFNVYVVVLVWWIIVFSVLCRWVFRVLLMCMVLVCMCRLLWLRLVFGIRCCVGDRFSSGVSVVMLFGCSCIFILWVLLFMVLIVLLISCVSSVGLVL